MEPENIAWELDHWLGHWIWGVSVTLLGEKLAAGTELALSSAHPGAFALSASPPCCTFLGGWPNAPGRALITSSRVLCIPCRFRQSFRNTITHCSVCCLLLPWILCSKRVQGVGLISATPAQDTVCPGIGLVRGAACPVFKGECAAPISQWLDSHVEEFPGGVPGLHRAVLRLASEPLMPHSWISNLWSQSGSKPPGSSSRGPDTLAYGHRVATSEVNTHRTLVGLVSPTLTTLAG